MDIRRQVGLNIKRLRTAKGWTQEELAFQAELHHTYISGIERGVRNPTVMIIARIAKTMEVPAHVLLEP